MSRRLLDDCFLTDKERLRHDEALAILRERVSRVVGTETVPLAEASGRILAETVRAPRPVPATDNAAVDGYAFAHAGYEASGGRMTLAMRLAAGHPSEVPLPLGAAARIFTGAVMPAGADTVAMQEDARLDGDTVEIPAGLKPGANRRRAGEDLAEGAQMLVPGERLRPQDVAALASIGRDGIICFETLSVALISTGDEIVRPGAPLGPGQVYDSNHYLLRALLGTIRARITDMGVLPDKAEAVEAALRKAAAEHHAVITTGGASRGEEDHLVATLDEIGKRHMWQIAVKPGRPMTFGQIGDCPVIGLPGNPVAVMVCFLLYARPALLALGGATWREPRRYRVSADFAMPRKKQDRREFLRGLLTEDAWPPRVAKYPRDGSGLITSLREADGLIELPEEASAVEEGDEVGFIPFSEFGITRT